MSTARSIRIFLATGEVTGIRHAELVNWTGQALACPRTRLQELESWPEARRPGVYLLLGAETTESHDVYFGESEDVLRRVKQHLASKEFWQELVIFTSKDEHLTKAHVRYLEHQLIQDAREAGRYRVLNGNDATESPLPRADRAAMDEFAKNIRLLLGSLGHRVFVAVAPQATATAPTERFRLTTGSAEAFGRPTDEGFVVFRGSSARKASKASMRPGYQALKSQLLEDGRLVAEGALLRFTGDVLFATPSQAATIIAGTACNGREMWKREADGLSLNEVEAEGSVSELVGV